MIFKTTKLPGVYVIELKPYADERGFFARTFDAAEFRNAGLRGDLVQCSLSHNPMRCTLRGMHIQLAPHSETKLVRCVRGAIFDVVLDLRPESPTHKDWFAIELTAENRQSIYIPEGCAHGFLTLCNDCEVFYQMADVYVPELSSGVRWNDPAFSIVWPFEPVIISSRDRSYPDYQGAA